MAGDDDLLSPEEIEALMAAARGSAPSSGPSGPAATPARPAAAPTKAAAPPPPDRLLQQAEEQLAEALSVKGNSRSSLPDLHQAAPFGFQDFGSPTDRSAAVHFPIAALQDVELDLRIELGRTELLIEEVLQLREGAVVPLDKLAGDPVDILVNGRLIARGEVLVLNDNFCVRVAEILAPHD